MKEIPIAEFKANCLRILEQARNTGEPILITRFGQPVAEIIPASPKQPGTKRRLGCMAGTGEILGDIVGPTGTWGDWGSIHLTPVKRG
jgi:prevent-host-death family protein